MVLEYNHEKMEKILEQFCDGQIARLAIYEQNGVYLINYSSTKVYTSEQQKHMQDLMDNNLPLRVKMQETLTQFIENMAVDNVQKMDFHFSMLDTNYIDLKMSLQLKNPNLVPSSNVESDILKLGRLCGEFDNLVQDMGIKDITIPGIFRREGAGKNRKYIQQTLGNLTEMVRSALEEK